MSAIFVFGIPMLATIPIAVLLCRYRLARKKRISYETLLVTTVCIPMLSTIGLTICTPDIWWSHEGKNYPQAWFGLVIFMTAMCALPALSVILFYQKRSKKHERDAA